RSDSETGCAAIISTARADELLEHGLQRTRAVVVVLPCSGLGKQRGNGLEGEALRVEAGAHLAPGERHRHRRTGPGSRRQAGAPGREEVVAQVVEVDASAPELLGHVDQVTVGGIVGHGRAYRAGERLGLFPADTVPLAGGERGDDVQALASGGLAE